MREQAKSQPSHGTLTFAIGLMFRRHRWPPRRLCFNRHIADWSLACASESVLHSVTFAVGRREFPCFGRPVA